MDGEFGWFGFCGMGRLFVGMVVTRVWRMLLLVVVWSVCA